MKPDAVAFDPRTGLAPAIVQAPDGRVLMLAWMDREALRRTLEGGRVTFRSRSRDRLWEKGETSGHWLEALEVRADCDADALLVIARPHGPTCHTGEETCFDAGPVLSVTALAGEGGTPDAAPLAAEDRGAPPAAEDRGVPSAAGDRDARAGEDREAPAAGEGRDAPAGSGPSNTEAAAGRLAAALERLEAVIAERDRERPEGSYTARLLAAGVPLAARKLGEEALETCLAAVGSEGEERLAAESADLVYHLLVLWRAAGLDPGRVAAELARRHHGREGPTTPGPTRTEPERDGRS